MINITFNLRKTMNHTTFPLCAFNRSDGIQTTSNEVSGFGNYILNDKREANKVYRFIKDII